MSAEAAVEGRGGDTKAALSMDWHGCQLCCEGWLFSSVLHEHRRRVHRILRARFSFEQAVSSGVKLALYAFWASPVYRTSKLPPFAGLQPR